METEPIRLESMELGPGQLIKNRYLLDRELGKGGMGIVYLARDQELSRREVVVKFLRDDLAQGDKARWNFQREIEALARIDHPAVVGILDAGRLRDGRPFIVMQFVDGVPLRDIYKGGGLSIGELGEILRQVGSALARAHERGVCHLDLKPENIMVQDLGNQERLAKVIDFGIASVRGSSPEPESSSYYIVGTIPYMAPEQLAACPNPSSDIYSLGVIAYEGLTGRRPYMPLSLFELPLLQKRGDFPKPSRIRPDLPPSVDEIISRALAFSPADRPQSARSFCEELLLALCGGADVPARLWTSTATHSKVTAQPDSGKVILDTPTTPAAQVQVGQAFLALRDKDYKRVRQILEEASSACDASSPELLAAMAHLRGALLCHEGDTPGAIHWLNEALRFLGSSSLTTARVVDTLGMAFAARNGFPIAYELFLKSIEVKERLHDYEGVALSHGQLGRLCLAWGHLDEASEHFQEDIQVSRRIRDERSVAQGQNHLGQVCLARTDWDGAVSWLDEAIRSSGLGGWPIVHGFALKDRALAYLGRNEIAEAEEDLARATEIFEAAGFNEGLAHLSLVNGRIQRSKKNWDEAETVLEVAYSHFTSTNEFAEAARCQLELAQVRRARGAGKAVIVQVLKAALRAAELSHNDVLVQSVENDLFECDPLESCKQSLRRARGPVGESCKMSLTPAQTGDSSILLLRLASSERPPCPGTAHIQIQLLNQIWGDLEMILEKANAQVISYSSTGFMALVQGTGHPLLAAKTALSLNAGVEELNFHRRVLGLPFFTARCAVSSGEVCTGNLGTYRKMGSPNGYAGVETVA